MVTGQTSLKNIALYYYILFLIMKAQSIRAVVVVAVVVAVETFLASIGETHDGVQQVIIRLWRKGQRYVSLSL